ncbi:MAG: hypothetical protein ACRCV3_02400 [Desulfovibrionaceae bacterium]
MKHLSFNPNTRTHFIPRLGNSDFRSKYGIQARVRSFCRRTIRWIRSDVPPAPPTPLSVPLKSSLRNRPSSAAIHTLSSDSSMNRDWKEETQHNTQQNQHSYFLNPISHRIRRQQITAKSNKPGLLKTVILPYSTGGLEQDTQHNTQQNQHSHFVNPISHRKTKMQVISQSPNLQCLNTAVLSYSTSDVKQETQHNTQQNQHSYFLNPISHSVGKQE